MDFASTIKSLRMSRGITQDELANRVGVSSVAVQGWERGTRKPSFDALVGLCSALSVSMDELLCIKHPKVIERPLSKQEQSLLSGFRRLDRFGQRVVEAVCREELRRINESTLAQKQQQTETRLIRRYFIPAAAGFSAPIEGEDYEMIMAGPEVPSNADYAVRIQGNSMAPYLYDGDVAYVQRDAVPDVGDVGIFCVDGAMYCKIYYKDRMGNVTLVSSNDALRETNVYLPNDSGRSVECLGKVLLIGRVQMPDYFVDGCRNTK